ncbi:MAG TPA: exopolyphosphatase, partial [Casimicrobiaceae bacterium]
MRVAIVDLGTNTCRLFLARVVDGRVLQDERVTTVVRLGQGVGETGRLHPDAVARTRACLSGYAPRVEAYGPARRLLIATSVLRDAADGRQFLRIIVRRESGLPWRVLSGEEEGGLAFRGGTSWLADGATRQGSPVPAGPLVLVDIGGGSTE